MREWKYYLQLTPLPKSIRAKPVLAAVRLLWYILGVGKVIILYIVK